MTIDLEHYLKVNLINDCQNNTADDGYKVVSTFLDSHTAINEAITAGARLAGYSGVSFEKYIEMPAVWNFVEMINFYDFINFYTFYYDYFKIGCEYSKHFDSVRRLRNAAAHNICMLSSFKPVQNLFKISNFILEIHGHLHCLFPMTNVIHRYDIAHLFLDWTKVYNTHI